MKGTLISLRTFLDMIQILNLGSSLGIVQNGKLTGYSFSSIESVTWEKDAIGYVVRITFLADRGCATEALLIPLRDVTNMPTWLDTTAGANVAVNDILSWITSGTSTPPVLNNILTTLQAFTEYEAVYVKDATNAVFLEVRVWNQDTQTWSSVPTYYAPGSNVAVVPVAPVVYLDPTTTLASWYSLYQNGVTRTPELLRVTTNGSTPAGVYSISFANVGTTNATVKSQTLKPGETVGFTGGGMNNKLGAISYTASATAELLIAYVN